MMQGGSRVSKDIPPFTIVRNTNIICGLNVVGLRRHGFTTEQRLELRKLYHALFLSRRKMQEALADARTTFTSEPSRIMNWSLPILTDSGGFQVFSLSKIRKIKPHGVEFRSHLDGSPLFLGPKESMEIQRLLGSDIAMVFDECPAHDCTPNAASAAVDRTLRWAAECREQERGQGQLVFGIVQGGIHDHENDPAIHSRSGMGPA